MKKILLILLLIVSSAYADKTRVKVFPDGDKQTVIDSGNKKGFANLEVKPEYKSNPVILDKITVDGVTIGEKLNTNDQSITPLKQLGYYSKLSSGGFYSKIEIGIVPSSGIVATISLIPNNDTTIEKCLVSKNYFLQDAFKKYGGEFINEPRLGYSFDFEQYGEIKWSDKKFSKGSITMNNGNSIDYSCFSLGKSVVQEAKLVNKQLYDKKIEEDNANYILNLKQRLNR